MRKEELLVWNSIKRTYLVSKGIDLEKYHPLEGITEKLSGEPSSSISRTGEASATLSICVWPCRRCIRSTPNARLHLYNCNDKRMLETFQALNKTAKWWTFLTAHYKDR